QGMKTKSPDTETSKISDDMVRQVDRVVAMTQEILDFSRGVSAVKMEVVDFPEFISSLFKFMSEDLRTKKIHLVKDLHFAGSVNIDQEKLARAFYNIIRNASDAM